MLQIWVWSLGMICAIMSCKFMKSSSWSYELKATTFMLKCCIMQHENLHTLFCQLAYEVITLIWWYMRVSSHHSMSIVTMIRLCCKFGFMHVFVRLKNVTCKLMNTFVPHLPPWLTCGLISILSCLCQVSSFNPLRCRERICEFKSVGLCYG